MPATYNRLEWVGEVVQYPRRYHHEEVDGEMQHIPAFGTVIQEGTPYTPENLNRIEHGVEDAINLANELEQTKIGQVIYRATIPVNNWTAGEHGGYTRVVNVAGVRASDTPIVDIVLTGSYDADADIADAWTIIQRIVAGNDRITITADEIPEVEIPIQVRCLR